jgi:hypothetical protein
LSIARGAVGKGVESGLAVGSGDAVGTGVLAVSVGARNVAASVGALVGPSGAQAARISVTARRLDATLRDLCGRGPTDPSVALTAASVPAVKGPERRAVELRGHGAAAQLPALSDSWVANFEDADGNDFQLATRM